MRVNCPNCAAGYEVPDHLLAAGGRTLRCARCGTTFQAGIAMGEAPGEAPAAPPSPVAIPPPPVTPTPVVATPVAATPVATRLVAPMSADPISDAVEPQPLTFPRAPFLSPEQRAAFYPPMAAARPGRSTGSGALLGIVGWLLTIVLLLAGTFEAVQQRSRIVAAWPASARVYDALGLNPAAARPSRPAATPSVAAP